METIRSVAQKVFDLLGTGLEPKVYIDAMKIGLQLEEQMFEEGREWPILYDGFSIGHTVGADLLVNQEVVVLVRVDDEDMFDYSEIRRILRVSEVKYGIVLNFGEDRLGVLETSVDGNVKVKYQ